MTNEQRYNLLFLLTTDRGSSPKVIAEDPEWEDCNYEITYHFRVMLNAEKHVPSVVRLEAFPQDEDYDIRYYYYNNDGWTRDIESETLRLIDEQLIRQARERIESLQRIIKTVEGND